MVGIAALVFQQQFHQNTSLPEIFLAEVAACAGHVHTDLGTGVAAQNRTCLHQSGFCTMSGSCDSCTDTGQAAADNDDIKFMVFSLCSTHI